MDVEEIMEEVLREHLRGLQKSNDEAKYHSWFKELIPYCLGYLPDELKRPIATRLEADSEYQKFYLKIGARKEELKKACSFFR